MASKTDAINAIHDVLARYASGADWVDEAMFSDVSPSMPSSTSAHSALKRQYVKMIMDFCDIYTRRLHPFGRPRIVVTEYSAIVEATCAAHMRRLSGDVDEIYFGQYLSALSNSSGIWRITMLSYVMSLEQCLPVRMSQSELRRAESLNNLHPLFSFRNGSAAS